VSTVEGRDEDRALALASATESDSEHLIARGIRATQDGPAVQVGGSHLLDMLELDLRGTLSRFTDVTGTKGQSVVYLVEDQQVVAAFALAGVIRLESRRAVERLHEMGVEVARLSARWPHRSVR